MMEKKMIGQCESNKQPNYNFTILELGSALALGHGLEGPQIWSGKLVFSFFFFFN